MKVPGRARWYKKLYPDAGFGGNFTPNMKLILAVLAAASCADALALTGAALRPALSSRASSAAMQFGRNTKKTVTPTLEERGYWAGEFNRSCPEARRGAIALAAGTFARVPDGAEVCPRKTLTCSGDALVFFRRVGVRGLWLHLRPGPGGPVRGSPWVLEVPAVRWPAPSLCQEGECHCAYDAPPSNKIRRLLTAPLDARVQAGAVLGKLDDTPMAVFIVGSLAAIAYLVYVAIST